MDPKVVVYSIYRRRWLHVNEYDDVQWEDSLSQATHFNSLSHAMLSVDTLKVIGPGIVYLEKLA